MGERDCTHDGRKWTPALIAPCPHCSFVEVDEDLGRISADAARIAELEAEVERRGRLIAEASDSEWPDSCLWCHETSRHADTCRAFNHDGSVRWGDPEGA